MNKKTTKTIFILILTAMTLCSCSNKRWYIGVDDYGEPEKFEHNFTTRGYNDNSNNQKSR